MDKGSITEKKDIKTDLDVKIIEDVKKYYLENDITSTSMLTLEGEEENLNQMIEIINTEFNDLETTPVLEFEIEKDGKLYRCKNIDVMKKNSSKGNGIEILAKHLNIKKEEIVVMGDGGNDLSMFEVAGYKVAMANGSEILKSKADYVTATNDEDGVAKALEKIFLGTEEKNPVNNLK